MYSPELNSLSEFGLKKFSKKKVIASWKTSVYFKLSRNTGIQPKVVSRLGRIQVDKAYAREVYVPTFLKKLMNITGMSEQWRVIPVSAILAETFRSLNTCQIAGEGRLTGELLPIKEINGYTKMRQHHEGKKYDDSPKSLRGGCRVESP
ncbi:hypothetical protein Godav_027358, partial [Gossypium davidsonii]|nr:hypothetical protein [Gossypium davidsonii]